MSQMTDSGDMRLRDVLSRRSTSARVHGRAGGAASAAQRPFTRWWRATSWAGRLMWLLVLASAAGVVGVATSGGLDGFVLGFSAGAAAVLILSSLLLVPGIVATVTVVLATIAVLPFMAWGYASASGLTTDIASAAVSLFVAYALAMFVVLRFGRGRTWVSASWVSVGLLIPGVPLLFAVPELGLNAARLSLALVVILRCGFAGWILAACGWAWDRLRYGRDEEKWSNKASIDPADVSAAWQRTAQAQKQVGQALEQLPAGYAVFHDVRVRKSQWSVEHVVVGPTGVSVVASVQALGDLIIDPVAGVQVPGADLGATSWGLYNAAEPVRKALGVHPRDIHFFIVVHGTDMTRMRFGVVDASVGPDPLTEAVAVPVKDLVTQIQAEFTWWSEVKVRQVLRRARMRFGSAALPVSSPRHVDRVHVSPVDLDGNLTVPAPEDSSSAEARVLQDGDPIILETNSGPIADMEASGEPFIDGNGVPVVRVRARGGAGARETRRSRRGYVFPLASVRRDIRSR